MLYSENNCMIKGDNTFRRTEALIQELTAHSR